MPGTLEDPSTTLIIVGLLGNLEPEKEKAESEAWKGHEERSSTVLVEDVDEDGDWDENQEEEHVDDDHSTLREVRREEKQRKQWRTKR